MSGTCLWCERPFEPRRDGGKRQRFCSADHRRDFHHAAGLWVASAIETGVMSRVLLREGLTSNAALVLSGPEAPAGTSAREPKEPPALPEVPPWPGFQGWPTAR